MFNATTRHAIAEVAAAIEMRAEKNASSHVARLTDSYYSGRCFEKPPGSTAFGIFHGISKLDCKILYMEYFFESFAFKVAVSVQGGVEIYLRNFSKN